MSRAEEGPNLSLGVGRVGGTPLVDDYVAGEERARAFYAGWWGDSEAYRAKAREVDERIGREERERAARAMRPAGDGDDGRLAAWVEAGGYVVTTGQQPGLFTGPLYAVYKALTAARLAEALAEVVGRPVLPLFWVASEDHDWEEASHAVVIDVGNDLRRIDVQAPPSEEGLPLHRVHPGEGLTRALEALLGALPDTDFSPRYREILERAYQPDATLPEAFRETLGALLAPFGVYTVDAADPVVKRASLPSLARELERAEAHEALLAERTRALEAAGYQPQVPILPGGVNLFVEGPAGRERLYRDDGTFHLRHSGERLEAADLERRLAGEPGTVSPNVLLRPVVESAVFPTLALVGGPGELAYFAQLGPYFEAFGVRPPVAHPRFGATVVEGKVAKVLEKFGLEREALARPFHDLAADVARDEVPPEVRRALGSLRAAIQEGSAALADAARAVDPTLDGPIRHARTVSFDAWSDAERKIVQAVKRENETALQQLEKAALHLFPDGKPQERVLNVFYYLFRYGDAFLEELARRFAAELDRPASRA